MCACVCLCACTRGGGCGCIFMYMNLSVFLVATLQAPTSYDQERLSQTIEGTRIVCIYLNIGYGVLNIIDFEL